MSEQHSPGKHAAREEDRPDVPDQPHEPEQPEQPVQPDPPSGAGEDSDRGAEETADETADETTDETADDGGTRQPGADPDDEEEIEAERERRLDPENRPDEVEVDNTQRDFDAEKGMFTDSEGYEEAEPRFPPMGDQGA